MGERRRHTEEFKREAVRLMESRGERTIAELAESFGVAESHEVLHVRRELLRFEVRGSSRVGISRQL